MNTKPNSLVNLIIPLVIVFSPYRVLGDYYSIGLTIVLIFGITSVLFFKNKILFHRDLLIFIISILFIYIINLFRIGVIVFSILNFLIGAVISVLLIGFLINGFNYEKFYKYYRIIVIIGCCIIIIQSIRLFIFNIPAVPINILPVSESDLNYWGQFLGARPSAFFTEPQAFASFTLPFVIFSLFKRDYWWSLLSIVAILLSTSTLGVISIVIILVLYFYYEKVNMAKYIYLLLLLVPGLFIIYYFGLLDFTTEKIASTQIENNIRLSRGFIIYSKLSGFDMAFGLSQDLQNYVLQNLTDSWINLYVEADNIRLLGYTTSYSGLLIYFGIIPFISYMIFLYRCFLCSIKEAKVLVIIIFILGFAQTIIFNPWFVFYVSILLGILYEKRSINLIKIKL